MHTYAFWNNKGGTGKTSLAFQTLCHFAHRNPSLSVLALDLCPQANLSELLLGGLDNHGSDNLLRRQGEPQRATVGGYFQTRLPSRRQRATIPHHFSPGPRNTMARYRRMWICCAETLCSSCNPTLSQPSRTPIFREPTRGWQ